MSAIRQIVDAYVRLADRRSLDDLLIHRQRLAAGMRGRSGFDFSLPLRQIDEEIAVISDGLITLDGLSTNDASQIKTTE
jgi:hypothetical protein